VASTIRFDVSLGIRQSSLAAIGAAWLLGCASEAPYVSDEDSGSTHALVSVERSRGARADTQVRAGALAGFVRVPATVDATTALGLVGLERQLPEPGQCASDAALRDTSSAQALSDPVELVAVGDVSVTAAGLPTMLAPMAFPTVTDLISGVVYSTRDLAADPLPAAASYLVRAAGSTGVDPLEISGRAPSELADVSVGGSAIASLRTVSAGAAIPLVWAPGDPADLVYVELTADAGPDLVCTFRDDGGAATVPAGVFAGRGVGRLVLHRLRTQPLEATGVQGGAFRFDFEVTVDVSYTE
jgi:hypothetical protein